jgi:hypothetical protein
MTVSWTAMHTFPLGLMTRAFSPPPTQAGAKQLARELNAEARREREEQEAEHRTRQRELAALTERTRAQDPVRPVRARGARIDVREIYRTRNLTEQERATVTEARDKLDEVLRDEAAPAPADARAPRRPRSFGELARDYYSDAPAMGTALVPSSPRGA